MKYDAINLLPYLPLKEGRQHVAGWQYSAAGWNKALLELTAIIHCRVKAGSGRCWILHFLFTCTGMDGVHCLKTQLIFVIIYVIIPWAWSGSDTFCNSASHRMGKLHERLSLRSFSWEDSSTHEIYLHAKYGSAAVCFCQHWTCIKSYWPRKGRRKKFAPYRSSSCPDSGPRMWPLCAGFLV